MSSASPWAAVQARGGQAAGPCHRERPQACAFGASDSHRSCLQREGGPGARPVGSAAWSLQVTDWEALGHMLFPASGEPHSSPQWDQGLPKFLQTERLCLKLYFLSSSDAPVHAAWASQWEFPKKEAKGNKECANLIRWKQARSSPILPGNGRYAQEHEVLSLASPSPAL